MKDSAIGMCLIAVEGTFIEVNPALCEFFGYDAATLQTKTWQELTHEADLGADMSLLDQAIRGEIEGYRMEKRYIAADGSTLVGDLRVRAIVDDSGAVSYFVSQIVDITEKAKFQQDLQRSEEHFRLLAQNSAAVVVRGDSVGRIVWISDAVTDVTSWQPDELAGIPFADLVHPDDVSRLQAIQPALQAGDQGRTELRVRCQTGDYKWIDYTVNPVLDDDGRIVDLVAIWLEIEQRIADRMKAAATITEARRDAKRLKHQAEHDPLTGLPNRRGLRQLLEARTAASAGAVLFIDIDDMKSINDRGGHHNGDQVLVQVAQSIRAAMGPPDVAARLGGDEFIAVLTSIDDEQGALRIAELIRRRISTSSYGSAFSSPAVTVSIGLAMFSESDSHSRLEAMQAADVALYRAKENGRNQSVAWE